MTSKTLVVVGCGSEKRGRISEARHLYTSTYFRKKREYAEAVGDQWVILSAEHGILAPTERTRPYDTTIDDLGEDDLDQLAYEVGMFLIDWVAWEQSDGTPVRVVVLVGKKYLQPLRERDAFSTAGADDGVFFPLQQNDLGGIGEQMEWLGERVEATTQRQSTLGEVLHT